VSLGVSVRIRTWQALSKGSKTGQSRREIGFRADKPDFPKHPELILDSPLFCAVWFFLWMLFHLYPFFSGLAFSAFCTMTEVS
jgi:hypothetical protein